MSKTRLSEYLTCEVLNGFLHVCANGEDNIWVTSTEEAIKLIVELEKFIKSKVEGENV